MSQRDRDRVPFAPGRRGVQGHRAGADAGKQAPRERCQLPVAWLTVEQNELLATRGADRAPRFDPDGALDGHAGRRTLEIFAAVLPFEWG
jgi:hypothetical protein